MPTEQDILNLKLGKITPADFDIKFGAGSSEKYLAVPQEEATEVPEKESRITEVPEQLVGAGIDTIKSTMETVAGLADLVGLQTIEDFGATIREKALEKGINIPAVLNVNSIDSLKQPFIGMKVSAVFGRENGIYFKPI